MKQRVVEPMNRLTVDSIFQAKLAGAESPLELCDADGHTLGYFHPVTARPRVGNEVTGSPYSTEELDILRQQEGGRSLSEIWKDLETS